ncbi:unnamed protein product, partial [marine sediment metagenome]
MSHENVDIEIIRAIHELISDEVYGITWLGVLDVAASKNAIYNAIEAAIGVGGHLHDMDILQQDGIDSDGGDFDFKTSGVLNLKVSGDSDDYLQLAT